MGHHESLAASGAVRESRMPAAERDEVRRFEWPCPRRSAADGHQALGALLPAVTDFVERALVFYATHGITPRRLQTDNAGAYAHHHRTLAQLLGRHHIGHRFIPPRTPKRNGKVKRYQRPAPANGPTDSYRNSDARAHALPIWLNHYNTTPTTAPSPTDRHHPHAEPPEAQ